MKNSKFLPIGKHSVHDHRVKVCESDSNFVRGNTVEIDRPNSDVYVSCNWNKNTYYVNNTGASNKFMQH